MRGNEVATKEGNLGTSRHEPRTMTGMAHRRSLVTTSVLAGVCALACGCSSASTTEPGTSESSSASPSTAAGVGVVQAYLDAVNTLCDALLPKVIEVTKGGSLDIPLKDFFAQLPAHAKLRSDFDRDVALVSVPPTAEAKANVLKAYVRFANELDAKRLAAARAGPAAYAKEIHAQLQTAAGDPSVAALTAAGFHDSCEAR